MLKWLFRLFAIGMLTLVIGGIMAMFGEAIWWLALLSASLLYFGEAFLLKRALGRALMAPFRMKGAILRNAVVEIHDIRAASAPEKSALEDEDDDAEEERNFDGYRHYHLEVTIKPQAGDTTFRLWEPGELAIVPENAPPEESGEGDDSTHAVLHGIEVLTEGKFVPDEGMKYPGPQRLKIHVGVPPSLKRGKFRYYLEDFGMIEFKKT